MKIYARHGDVAFIKAKNKNKSLVTKKDKKVALGEVTGHSHQFLMDGVKVLVDASQPNWGRALEVEIPVEITHEEHKAIPFEPGSYVVRHQRTFSDVGINKVLD